MASTVVNYTIYKWNYRLFSTDMYELLKQKWKILFYGSWRSPNFKFRFVTIDNWNDGIMSSLWERYSNVKFYTRKYIELYYSDNKIALRMDVFSCCCVLVANRHSANRTTAWIGSWVSCAVRVEWQAGVTAISRCIRDSFNNIFLTIFNNKDIKKLPSTLINYHNAFYTFLWQSSDLGNDYIYFWSRDVPLLWD